MPVDNDLIATLNGLDLAPFVARLGAIFEHAPWVAEDVYGKRPFASLNELHQAMCEAVANAERGRQLELLRAHPQLAGRAARAGKLTAASNAEQSRAGLTALTADELARVDRLNQRYHNRFGFPFIIAVGHHDKHSIFEHWEKRIAHDADEEFAEALRQVYEIARLRLEAL